MRKQSLPISSAASAASRTSSSIVPDESVAEPSAPGSRSELAVPRHGSRLMKAATGRGRGGGSKINGGRGKYAFSAEACPCPAKLGRRNRTAATWADANQLLNGFTGCRGGRERGRACAPAGANRVSAGMDYEQVLPLRRKVEIVLRSGGQVLNVERRVDCSGGAGAGLLLLDTDDYSFRAGLLFARELGGVFSFLGGVNAAWEV